MSNKTTPEITRDELVSLVDNFKTPISDLAAIAVEKECTITIDCFPSGSVKVGITEKCGKTSYTKEKYIGEKYERYEESEYKE